MLGNHSLSGLMKWLTHEEWREPFVEVLDLHLGPACEDYEMDFEDIAEVIGDHAAMTLWGCAFEDFLAQAIEPDGRNVVEDYLKRRGWKESAGNRRYMEALRNSCMSLYEVSEIVPGQSFLARDLLRGGEPISVSEHSATKSLKVWDKIGARIVEVSGKNILAGGLLPFRPSAATLLMDELKAARTQARRDLRKLTKEAQLPRATREDGQIADLLFMATAAPIFSNIWLDDALASALDQSLPTILNSDGDEVVFCRVRFPLRSEGAAAEIRERLRSIPAFQEENEGFWNWIEPGQPATRKSSRKPASRFAPGQGTSVRVTLDTGDTVLGTIELTDKALLLEVNSRERAERGQTILAELAGALVGPALIEIETLEQAMARRDRDIDHKANDLPADVQTELIHEALTDHYRKTLDEPIPALGDLSPRGAVQTVAGRRKVVDWLKHIENQSKGGRQPDDPMVSYDFTWLWRDLGLEKLRR
ncbi:hypothetical protein [Microvirga arabica]|uniref:Antitoxin Xre/MbcA/ParS-like toxin-binding domain-containing protein n=1 Tax=Microvirga arabica TaxID=1128671 RepID=A0ABV6Y4P9_9HYPH|nr:hypothetical protein [Microvirga arabica]MBM1172906.1 hypothetical protein [Microvirga arabica]